MSTIEGLRSCAWAEATQQKKAISVDKTARRSKVYDDMKKLRRPILKPFRIFVSCVLVTFANLVNAHEFWLSPSTYLLPSGESLEVAFSFGDDFDRTDIAYIPQQSKRFEVHLGDANLSLAIDKPRDPAAKINGIPDGLAVLIYERNADLEVFIYNTPEKFESFLDTHGIKDDIDWESATHPVAEKYNRFAKALVRVGAGFGQDKYLGMETEIVAVTNPYLPKGRETMSFELYAGGTLQPDRQIELYSKRLSDGAVTRSLHRTNADGRVKIDVAAGHEYLLNSITYRPSKGAEQFESLWASLSFVIPSE